MNRKISGKFEVLFIHLRISYIAIAFILTGLASTAMAELLQVKNVSVVPRIMSDLKVTGVRDIFDNDGKFIGNEPASHIFLAPGDSAAKTTDDIQLNSMSSASFDLSLAGKYFHILDALISFYIPIDPKDPTIPGTGSEEFDSKVIFKKFVNGVQIGFFIDPDSKSPLFAVIDTAVAVAPPPTGTVLDFSAGLSNELPGWFMGTALDFSSGDVTGAFTGNGTVALTGIELSLVPEPTTPALVALALVGILLFSRITNYCKPVRRFRVSKPSYAERSA